MSERLVVLLLARDGVTHAVLGAVLADDCALLGARTVAAAMQLVRRRPPHVVLIDDSFEDLDGLTAGLREGAPHARPIVLATPNRPGTNLARLAVFGPVIAKPYDNASLRTLVVNTARLAAAAEAEVEAAPGAAAPGSASRNTTKLKGGLG